MANVSHASLTGSNLHEPKGADTALTGTVYVSDGAGSGNWVLASTLLSVAAWSTGDVKPTFKTVVDDGWVFMDDGSIGDASSAATTRANADCEDLFTLLWNGVSDTFAPVSGGRGASAANDWAAHKRITLPRALGRALACYGAGSGLTSRTLGTWLGVETHTLVTGELPSHTHSVAVSGNTGTESANHSHTFSGNTGTESVAHTHSYTASNDGNVGFNAGGIFAANNGTFAANTGSESANHTHAYSGTTSTVSAFHTHAYSFSGNTGASGSGTAHQNMQPTLFLNIMIKL